MSNTPKHNLDKDVVKNNRPMQNLGDMKDNIPEWKMNIYNYLLATNATHTDFNKPTDSRMVAMPMAAS